MIVRRLRSIGCAAGLLLVLAGCGRVGDSGPSVAPTSTPEPSSEPAPRPTRTQASGDGNVIYATSFEDDAGSLFYVGETSFGARASITDGKYVVEVTDGDWQTITPAPMPYPNNAVVQADITLVGAGFGGLVARSSKDDSGADWLYVCLIDNTGWAGCVATRGGQYADLFWSEVEGYEPGAPQRMRLSVVNDQIELRVNNQMIGSVQDATITSGAWGVYAESQSAGTTTVSFDNFSISVQQSPPQLGTPSPG